MAARNGGSRGPPLPGGEAKTLPAEQHPERQPDQDDHAGSKRAENGAGVAPGGPGQRGSDCAAETCAGGPLHGGGDSGAECRPEREGGQHAGDSHREAAEATMRRDPPRPSQRRQPRQRRGGAKRLQQQVGRDGAGWASQVGGGGGGRGVERRVVGVVAGERQQQRHPAQAKGKPAQLGHPPAHERADGGGGKRTGGGGSGHASSVGFVGLMYGESYSPEGAGDEREKPIGAGAAAGGWQCQASPNPFPLGKRPDCGGMEAGRPATRDGAGA